ncbi:MAG: hypothetical protein ABIQ58_04410 [Candidatus Limnocylindrales bacterium]
MRRTIRILAMAAMGLGLLTSPVSAAKPQTERIVVDESFADTFLTDECRVPVTTQITGHITLRLFTDGNGDPVREVNNYALTARYTSASASIVAKDVGVDRITYLPDGSLIRVVIGNVQSFAAPGKGRVYANVGQTTFHITFDTNGDPIFDVIGSHGQHDPDQVSAICSILAG